MRVWAFLGSHRLGAALLALIGLVALLGGTLPQSARLSPEERQQWQTDWSAWSVWLDSLRLSDIFGAPWFLALVGLLAVNLAVGTIRCTSRRWRQWRAGRRQAEGPAPGLLGLVGVPVLHLGLLVTLSGALISMQAGFGAHLELTEGEVYHGGRDKLILARGEAPGVLPGPVRLDRARVEIEEGRYLRELAATVTHRGDDGAVHRSRVRSNEPLELSGYRYFPDNHFGYSAILERRFADGSRRLLLVNFPVPRTDWTGAWQVARNKRLVFERSGPVYFRMGLSGPAEPRFTLEAEGGVEYQGTLSPGETADLGPFRLHFRGVAPWLGLYVARDPGAPVAFAGMLLTLGGFLAHLLVPLRNAGRSRQRKAVRRSEQGGRGIVRRRLREAGPC